jgi:transposase
MTRLLWIGRQRTIESFQGFFIVIGDELASKIVFVCSDMWQPYLKVIREKCSQALHILDRFHIVAKMNLALDDVRAEESNRMRREGRVPVLKKSRWLLLRLEQNLKDDHRFGLRDLLRYNLKIVRAYLLKASRKPFSNSGITTRPHGPGSSSTNGAVRQCAPALSR